MKLEYRNSVLEQDPEECPNSAILRYMLDRDNWIEVTTTSRGIEIRSNGGHMAIEPLSGNNVEVYLQKRGFNG